MREDNFEKWFVAQFGKRPSAMPTNVLKEKARDAETSFHRAQQIFEITENWDRMWDTALKAKLAFEETSVK